MISEENKKEVKGKKYDGFAIASFVISLFILLGNLLSIIPFFIVLPEVNSMLIEFLILLSSITFTFFASITSIILGIVALIRIKKNKSLKGKSLAIIGILLTILSFIVFVAFGLLLTGGGRIAG